MDDHIIPLLGQIITFLGGIQVIVVAMFSLGSTIWMKKIDGKHKADLGKYKSTLDGQLHVHKLQFEKEGGVYEEVWGTLVELTKPAFKLRPVSESGDDSESEVDRKQKRLAHLNKGNYIRV